MYPIVRDVLAITGIAVLFSHLPAIAAAFRIISATNARLTLSSRLVTSYCLSTFGAAIEGH